ncbi:hypothetical protein CR513_55349, partial [Mucuna pruriens]
MPIPSIAATTTPATRTSQSPKLSATCTQYPAQSSTTKIGTGFVEALLVTITRHSTCVQGKSYFPPSSSSQETEPSYVNSACGFIISPKPPEVVNTIIRRRRTNITHLQEAKWAGERAKEVDITRFKLWYTIEVRGKNETRIGRKIWCMLNGLGTLLKETINIINAYVLQVGLEALLKEKFWEDLAQGNPQEEKILIGSDLSSYTCVITATKFRRIIFADYEDKKLGIRYCKAITSIVACLKVHLD